MSPVVRLTDEQRALVAENYLLVSAGVQEYGKRCGWKITSDDLTLEFGLALCKAARTYDAKRGAFSSWAFWWFYSTWTNMLQNYFRRGVSAPRGTKVFYVDIPELSSRRAALTENKDDGSLDSLDTEKSRDERRKAKRASDLVEMREEYRAVRDRLSDQQQEVLDYLEAGLSLREVGGKLGMSKQGAEYIKKGAIAILQTALRQRQHESIKAR